MNRQHGYGIKGGEGTIGSPSPKRELCDCDNCRTQRLLYCQSIEGEIEAARAAGSKKCPPPLPMQNAETTFRLQ